MNIVLKKSKLSGTVLAPPSKSMAHRLLICASLCKSPATVKNIALSKDIEATINCLKALGVKVDITGTDAVVDGSGLFLNTDTLNCNESGSTLRFMLPLCLLANKQLTLTGTERLFSRSLSVYEQLCAQNGFDYTATKTSVTVKGSLNAGHYKVAGDISSQFISGLLFALSTLDADSTIEITGKVESAPYIDMTIFAQNLYGAKIRRKDNIIKIKGGQKYKPATQTVEGDCSNAAFFEALRVLGHDISVLGLNPNTLQGDIVFYDYFKKLCVSKPTLDVSNCPDLAPVIMAVAAAKYGAVLVGTKRLKIKESDRGLAMKKELKKFGVDVKLFENEIHVSCGIKPPSEQIFGHNDHRIVMACAVLLTLTGGKICGYECVSKSFADFFDKMQQLGTEIEYEA